MGFKKTEEGNVIYEFDFTPTKLVPVPYEICKYDHMYTVQGEHGEQAPVLFEFQGNRHERYAILFGSMSSDVQRELNVKETLCVCSNIQIIATFAQLNKLAESEGSTFDPWATDTLSAKGIIFPVATLEEAQKYVAQHSIPTEGYDVLRQRMS